MAQSSLDMSSLSIVSIEILEWITSVITTSQQMRLWQCGDRILNIKLKNGGLKRSSLSWSGPSRMPWPRWYFTTFNRLEDVEWRMDIGTSLCPALELNLLPKTLKRLYLNCDDLFLLIYQQNVNMNALLPLLDTLHLFGCGYFLRQDFLKTLPSNLIELSCVVPLRKLSTKIESSNIFGDLPRSIERLKLGFSIEDLAEHGNDLPSQLISLAILDSIQANFNWFRKLPRSLKMLEIGSLEFHPDWCTLPPQLEKLKLPSRYFEDSVVPQLPRSLKSLELHSSRFAFNPTILLPVSFKFPGCTLSSSVLERLPASTLSSSILQQLPASITDFGAPVATDHPDILSLFPPETIRIRLSGGQDPAPERSLELSPFPTKLQYLCIPYINDDVCANLPAGLQEIAIQRADGKITAVGASKLPTSLTSVIAPFGVFDCAETMRCLGSVTKLELSGADWSDDSGSENWLSFLLPRRHTLTDPDEVKGCNDHLASLKVSMKHFFGLLYRPSRELIKFTNLNSLELTTLDGLSCFSCDFFGLIPQTVTDLCIRSLNEFPTATQLSWLPKRLIYLNLHIYLSDAERKQNCCWNDQILESLPRSLQWILIDGAENSVKFTDSMYDYLPPNLQTGRIFGTEVSPPLRRHYAYSRPKMNRDDATVLAIALIFGIGTTEFLLPDSSFLVRMVFMQLIGVFCVTFLPKWLSKKRVFEPPPGFWIYI